MQASHRAAIDLSRAQTPPHRRKATRAGAPSQEPGRPSVVRELGMYGRSLCGNREICGLAGAWSRHRSAWGRREADAHDARPAEVRLTYTSDEVGEQTWATGSGVDGAGGEDQGEREKATSEPDTELGNRHGARLKSSSFRPNRVRLNPCMFKEFRAYPNSQAPGPG